MSSLPSPFPLVDPLVEVKILPGEKAEISQRKGLLAGLLLTGANFLYLWAAFFINLGLPVAAGLEVFYGTIAVVSWVWLKLTGRNFYGILYLHLVAVQVMPLLVTVSLGGFIRSGCFFVWALLSPMAALVFHRPRAAWIWLLVFVVLLSGTVLSEPYLHPQQVLQASEAALFTIGDITGVQLMAIGILYYFLRQLSAEQARADLLLLNVLPEEIAERLKRSPNAIAEEFPIASILFADVVGFTRLSARIPAMQVVEMLNELYSVFDGIARAKGLEKIKTIGDCYMVASGVPRARRDHAALLVNMAIEMQRCVKTRAFAGHHIQLRIGIHSGPVAAGVIGAHRFIYDLWGDSVNIASRMESHGRPGCIHVSRNTWDLIQADFSGRTLGMVELNNRGPMEVWEVLQGDEIEEVVDVEARRLRTGRTQTQGTLP